MPKALSFPNLFGAAVAGIVGGLAGWWVESRSRESELEERTRVRLRRWQLR